LSNEDTITQPNGVASEETILSFEQAGYLVFDRYSGGTIAKGYLIGKRASVMSIEFCYLQVHLQGRVDAGKTEAFRRHTAGGAPVMR
jgi:hypothetical protein